MMRLILPLAAALLVLWGCGSDDVPADPNQTFTFKLAPKTGEKIGFSFVSNSDGRTAEIITTMSVKQADEKGALFEQNVETLKINGADADEVSIKTMRKMLVTISADAKGKVLDLKVQDAPPGASASDPDLFTLPAKPVKSGDTWPGDLYLLGKRAKADYKLLGVVTTEGRQVANVEVTVTELPGIIFDGPIRGSFDVTTGMPLSLKASVRGAAEGDAVTSLEKKRL